MTSNIIPLLWKVQAIMRGEPDEREHYICASETGCFMSYLCSCSGGAARVECSSSVVVMTLQ